MVNFFISFSIVFCLFTNSYAQKSQSDLSFELGGTVFLDNSSSRFLSGTGPSYMKTGTGYGFGINYTYTFINKRYQPFIQIGAGYSRRNYHMVWGFDYELFHDTIINSNPASFYFDRTINCLSLKLNGGLVLGKKKVCFPIRGGIETAFGFGKRLYLTQYGFVASSGIQYAAGLIGFWGNTGFKYPAWVANVYSGIQFDYGTQFRLLLGYQQSIIPVGGAEFFYYNKYEEQVGNWEFNDLFRGLNLKLEVVISRRKK